MFHSDLARRRLPTFPVYWGGKAQGKKTANHKERRTCRLLYHHQLLHAAFINEHIQVDLHILVSFSSTSSPLFVSIITNHPNLSQKNKQFCFNYFPNYGRSRGSIRAYSDCGSLLKEHQLPSVVIPSHAYFDIKYIF